MTKQSRWSRWDELGQCLFDHLHALDIPPLPAPKRRIRNAPDQHTGPLSPNSHYQPSAAKRIRLQEAPDDSDDGSDTPLRLTSAYPASSRILSPPALASHTIASQEPSGPVVNARAPLAHLCRPLNPAVRRRSPPLNRQPSPHHQDSNTARQDTQTYRSPDMYPPLQVPTPIIPFTIERTEPAERPDVPANTRPHSVVHMPQSATPTPPVPLPQRQCLNQDHQAKGPMLILHEGEKRCLYCILAPQNHP